jgi:hypothetical protein
MLWLSSRDQVPKLKAANPGINHKVRLMSQLELQALEEFCLNYVKLHLRSSLFVLASSH